MATAIGYVRISSDVDELRYGVERQRQDVAALAERLGADLVRVFEDNDVSAFTERGPETAWQAMLGYIREHRPDFVLAYRMDRFGRRMGDIEASGLSCRPHTGCSCGLRAA
jgi:DNA invertase Pin-like site-specific DNA recombinase